MDDAEAVGVFEGVGSLDAPRGDLATIGGGARWRRRRRACDRFGLGGRRDAGDSRRFIGVGRSRSAPLLGDQVRQRAALDKLHCEEVDAALLPDRVDGDDVLMVQTGGGAGFVVEALQLARVERGRERQYLQGDTASE